MAAKSKKKKAREMTTEEAIRTLFPKKVIDRIREALANDDDDDDRKKRKAKKGKK